MQPDTSPVSRDSIAHLSSSLTAALRLWNARLQQTGTLTIREFLDGIAEIFYAQLVLWWEAPPDGNLILKESGGPFRGQHFGKMIERGQPLAGQSLIQGKPILLPRLNLTSDSGRKEISRRLPRAQSGMAFPVSYAGQVIGAIEIWNPRDGTPFTVDYLKVCQELLDWLPPYIAGIVAQEHREAASRMNQRFIALSLAFAASPDLKSLVSQIAQEAKSLLTCEEAALLLHDENTQTLYDPGGRISKRVPLSEGIVGTVFWKGSPIIASPVSSHPNYIPGVDALFPIYTRELVAAPLTTTDRVIGVLVAYNKSGGRFSERDLETVTPFAGLATVAIENQIQRLSIRQNFINSIEALVQALEAKDPETRGHSVRVRNYAMAIGRQVIRDPDLLQALDLSALLHDIGKIGMRDDVLFKPGALTDEEWKHIKDHPLRGIRILEPLIRETAILHGVQFHHERWDGSGYPEGLKGDEIPIFARIIAVADTFDALTADRPYRKGDDPMTVLAYLRKNSGVHFDPRMVDALARSLDRGEIEVRLEKSSESPG